MTFAKQQLKAAHTHCSNNRQAISKSTLCGCFYCQETYPAGEVSEYTYSGRTNEKNDAICPKCGIDSVLADADGAELVNAAFLEAMYELWFNTDCEDEASQPEA
jgi:hypothetical protein